MVTPRHNEGGRDDHDRGPQQRREHRDHRHEARGGHHPRHGSRPCQGVLRSLGWRLDADFVLGGVRAIQFTPPGSGCSIHFSTNTAAAPPGSAQGLFLIVSDIDAARDELTKHGAEIGEVFHLTPDGRGSGPAPDRGTYNSYAAFSDPDGNGWLLQEVTTRLPGRIDPGATTFTSANDLASALRRAAAAHGEHEKRTGEADTNWPEWYAEYMVSAQAGTELPT